MRPAFIRRKVTPSEARKSFFANFIKLLSGRPLVVWGAGRAGQLTTKLLQENKFEPAWIADRDPRRVGDRLQGIRIGLPSDLRAPGTHDGGDFVVIASMYASSMATGLQSRGWRPHVDFCIFPNASIYNIDFGFLLHEFKQHSFPRQLPKMISNEPVHRMPVSIIASSRGNFYFRELRDFLIRGLQQVGWTVRGADETVSSIDGIPIVVGPHEFFSIGDGIEWFSHENLRAAVLVGTEQPQSLWNQEFAPVFANAGAVVDISPNGTNGWCAKGIAAEWIPLGWYDSCDPFDRLPEGLMCPNGFIGKMPSGSLCDQQSDLWDNRPIDVLFIGSKSPRREKILNALRKELHELNWFVFMPSDKDPLLTTGTSAIDSATFVALARQSKILLNLHRDDTAFWEWQRIVWRGLWQRALVVTEDTGTVVPPLVAGEDFIEVAAHQMAKTIGSLCTGLEQRQHADSIRISGTHKARERLTFCKAVKVLENACAKVTG